MSANPFTNNFHLRRAEVVEIACAAAIAVALSMWVVGAEPQLKWIVAVLLGLVGCVFLTASSDAKKTLLVLTVISLQANVNFFLIVDRGSSWVGASGAEGIALPLMAIPATLLVLQCWFQKRRGNFFLEKELVVPFLLMFVTVAMTIPYAPSKRNVIYNLFEMCLFLWILFAARNTIRTRDDVVLIIKVLLTVLATQSVIYFVQDMLGYTFNFLGATTTRGATLGDVKRYGGTVSVNAKGFSSFITPVLLLAVSYYLIGSKRRGGGYLLGLLCGIGVAALIMSFTRMSWVGFGFGCIWILGVGLWRRQIAMSRLVPFLAATAAAIVLLMPSIMVRLSANATSDLEERMNLMKMALLVIEANPLWGIGSGGYPAVFRSYLTGDLIVGGHWLFVVHNHYLLRWAETGIFGLLSLLIFLASGLRLSYRSSCTNDRLLASLSIGWTAGLISSMWEMFWDIALGLQTSLLFWFMLGLMLAIKKMPLASPATAKIPRTAAWSVPPLHPGRDRQGVTPLGY